MKKTLIFIAVLIMSFNCYAMTNSEFVSLYTGYSEQLESMNRSANCLTTEQHINFSKDIYNYGIECAADGFSAASQNGGDYQTATRKVISRYENLQRKWKNIINNMGGSDRNSFNRGDLDMGTDNYEKKKKIIGHANVGAKIWSAGDNANDLFSQNAVNPIENQINNNTIINDDSVYFDLGNMGSIQGPKILELDNGKIEIINAKTGMNIDEDGRHPYIELQYKATIYDSKKESLKFHLNSIEINVSVYDETTTYTFSDKGNYTIVK